MACWVLTHGAVPDQAAAWFPEEEEAAFQMLGRWCGALGYILVAHLNGSPGLDPKAEVCDHFCN